MVQYSINSPSFNKENQFIDPKPRRMARFNAGNIFGDPFALATISISIVCISITIPTSSQRGRTFDESWFI